MAYFGIIGGFPESSLSQSENVKYNSFINQSGLPHLSLPYELDVVSRNSTSKFQLNLPNKPSEDLILLGDFSEMEGPIPLVTIPIVPRLPIDLNDFIVKLMSIDYQNISAGEFQIFDDTQLLQLDIEEGIHAYVHYFTLYDARARGFVRPMCLAFISTDARKLHKYFPQLQKQFHTASSYLKQNNLEWFFLEMKSRMVDLHYTKERYIISHKNIQQKQTVNDKTVNVKQTNTEISTAGTPVNKVFRQTSVTYNQIDNDDINSKSSRLNLSSSNLLNTESSMTDLQCYSDVVSSENEIVVSETEFNDSSKLFRSSRDDTDIDNYPFNTIIFHPGDNKSEDNENNTSLSIPEKSDSSVKKKDNNYLSLSKVKKKDSLSEDIDTVVPARATTVSVGRVTLSEDVDSVETIKATTGSVARLKLSEDVDGVETIKATIGSVARVTLSEDVDSVETIKATTGSVARVTLSEVVDSVETIKATTGSVARVTLSKDVDSVVAVRVTTGSIAHLTLKEEYSILCHTSLDALHSQIIDCQHILNVVQIAMVKVDVSNYLNKFLEEIKSRPNSLLYSTVEDIGILSPKQVSESDSLPSVFVMSVIKRTFADMRTVETITGMGYVGCLEVLLQTYDNYSKPMITLMFEDLDKGIIDNPLDSLFIGNIPVIQMKKQSLNKNISNKQPDINICDQCWKKELIELLKYFSCSTAATTPNSSSCINSHIYKLNTSKSVDNLNATSPINKEIDQNTNIVSSRSSNSYFEIKGIGCNSSSRSSSSNSWTSAAADSPDVTCCVAATTAADGADNDTSADRRCNSMMNLNYKDIDKRVILSKDHHLSSLMQQFSGVSHCILYSLLSGRPIVIAAPSHLRSTVVTYTDALTNFLPYPVTQSSPVLKWHMGTITNHHVEKYRIMGLCIPERLHMQDLMANSTLNQVTVLNIETGHISGVAYGGNLLFGTEQFTRKSLNSNTNSALQIALQALLVSLGLKTFLLYHLQKTTSRTSKEILKSLGIPSGDWTIIMYLTSILKQQATLDTS